MADLSWLSDYVITFMKSPTWIAPISQFIDERCCIFEEAEENQHAHLQCQEEFKHLVQDLFVAHLLEVSVTPEEFERFCASGLAADQQLHKSLVEQLLSVDDFLTFKAMMSRHNAELCREVVTYECIDDEDGEVLSPTRVANAVVANSIAEGIQMSGADWQIYEDQQFKSSMRFGNSLAGTMNLGGTAASLGSTLNSNLGVTVGGNLAGTMGGTMGGTMNLGGTMVSSLGGTMSSQLGAELAGDLVQEMVSNIDLMCEEARLEHAIALQLLIEEERLRQATVMEQSGSPPMQLPSTAGFISAPLQGLPPRMKQQPDGTGAAQEAAPAIEMPRLVQVEPLRAQPWGFTSAPLMRPPTAQPTAAPGAPAPAEPAAAAAVATPAPQLPPNVGFASSPLCFRPPTLKLPEGIPEERRVPSPIPELPKADFSGVEPQTQVQEMASNLAEWRQRAQQAMTGAEEGALRRPPRRAIIESAAASKPTEEERAARAEHLRRQRDALIAKRNADRERQVSEIPQKAGRQNIDGALAVEERRAAGRRLVAELTPGAHVATPGAAQADAPVRAEQMRQALTSQLRQTLCQSMVSDAGLLQDQITTLHALRRQNA